MRTLRPLCPKASEEKEIAIAIITMIATKMLILFIFFLLRNYFEHLHIKKNFILCSPTKSSGLFWE
jgi:hypothetical protein